MFNFVLCQKHETLIWFEKYLMSAAENYFIGQISAKQPSYMTLCSRHDVLLQARANEWPGILYQCPTRSDCSLAVQGSVCAPSHPQVRWNTFKKFEVKYFSFSWFHVNSNLLQPVSYNSRLHSVAHMLLVEDTMASDAGQYRSDTIMLWWHLNDNHVQVHRQEWNGRAQCYSSPSSGTSSGCR